MPQLRSRPAMQRPQRKIRYLGWIERSPRAASSCRPDKCCSMVAATGNWTNWRPTPRSYRRRSPPPSASSMRSNASSNAPARAPSSMRSAWGPRCLPCGATTAVPKNRSCCVVPIDLNRLPGACLRQVRHHRGLNPTVIPLGWIERTMPSRALSAAEGSARRG